MRSYCIKILDYLSILLSIYLSIYLFIYLSICLPIYLSYYISIHLSVCPSKINHTTFSSTVPLNSQALFGQNSGAYSPLSCSVVEELVTRGYDLCKETLDMLTPDHSATTGAVSARVGGGSSTSSSLPSNGASVSLKSLYVCIADRRRKGG